MAKGTFWVGGGSDNKWSNSQNWSTSSGGAGGAAVPNSPSAFPIFDANSGSGQVDLDMAIACRGIQAANFAGEFVGSGALSLGADAPGSNVAGFLTLGSGCAYSATGLISFIGASGAITAPNQTLPAVDVALFSTGTLTLYSDVNTSGSWTVTSGTVNQNGFLLNGS